MVLHFTAVLQVTLSLVENAEPVSTDIGSWLELRGPPVKLLGGIARVADT